MQAIEVISALSDPAHVIVILAEPRESCKDTRPETDIQKALSASNPPQSTAKSTLIAVIIAIAILGGLAAAGWLYFTGYDSMGPLPTSAPAIAGVLRL